MNPYTFFQVDAFSNGPFTGNPAGVCLLKQDWLPETIMQQIAMENNLAETAFVKKTGETWYIRWFTPTVEVDLCGHATLASAHVMFFHEGYAGQQITFQSRSGELHVKNNGELLTLDFPSDNIVQLPLNTQLLRCFETRPVEAWKGKTDYIMVFEKEEQIAEMKPDMDAIRKLEARGVIITAAGNSVDFVSRFFGPQSGVPEDPVTGSAHTTLTPYWSARLNKKELTAMQLSNRKGWLKCLFLGERVEISGKAIT